MSLLPWDKMLSGVNSTLDWAIVLGAGTLGFTLDAAINIVPVPVFSPGVCGLTAMTSALAAKKAVDAATSARRQKRLAELALRKAQELVDQHAAWGDHQTADELMYLLERARIDPAVLVVLDEAILRILDTRRR